MHHFVVEDFACRGVAIPIHILGLHNASQPILLVIRGCDAEFGVVPAILDKLHLEGHRRCHNIGALLVVTRNIRCAHTVAIHAKDKYTIGLTRLKGPIQVGTTPLCLLTSKYPLGIAPVYALAIEGLIETRLLHIDKALCHLLIAISATDALLDRANHIACGGLRGLNIDKHIGLTHLRARNLEGAIVVHTRRQRCKRADVHRSGCGIAVLVHTPSYDMVLCATPQR